MLRRPLFDGSEIDSSLLNGDLVADGVVFLDVRFLRNFPCRVLLLNAFHVAAEEIESLKMQLFRLLFEG